MIDLCKYLPIIPLGALLAHSGDNALRIILSHFNKVVEIHHLRG